LEQFKRRRDPDQSSPFSNHLGLLHYLRQICTDPHPHGETFTPEPLADYRKKSPKLDWLLDTLKSVRQKKEKAIVFVEFRPMQRMLVHYIEEVFGYRPDVINGDTTTSVRHAQSRQKRIAAFQQEPGFGVIVLSPIAVGFGVNIQAANHVFHYSRTWNPAKEDQATDRAYRIGQTKPVYVYYPVVYADGFKTFDEKLHELLEYKRGISKDMLNGTGNILPSEFEDVIEVGGDVFNVWLTIDDAIRFQPDYFEALTAALWSKRVLRLSFVWAAKVMMALMWLQKPRRLAN
jgi:SNF2 family DNA or RNA helicase